MKTFPPNHEIRFAQHLTQICEVALHNLDGCIEHWTKIVSGPTREYDKKEVRGAEGFFEGVEPQLIANMAQMVYD